MGFTVTETGNSPVDTRITQVSYAEGMEERAEQVASRLPGARAVREAGAPRGLVTVTVGEDFGGVR